MLSNNADRLIASFDAGTNGGTARTRPSTVPSSSATLLVTQYVYNAAGWVQDITDPMGIDTRTNYDNLGRVTQTIQDYTNGTETTESNISTEYGYDGNNNVTYVQADEPGASYQKTAYVYGVTTAGGSGVNSNDILSAVQHPDPNTGNPSSSQQDTYLVNALGQAVQYTDRNGSVHQYTYDVLGRLTSDAVTTLGTGVDGSVRRIAYAYDSQGNNYLITSYNAASGGSIVNQVQRVFNGLGQLTGEYQSHSGAVVPGTTPEVQYAYTEMSGGQNNSRLTSMTYPSGYILSFNYNTGLDSNISRLSSISDSANTLESYKYLGLDTVVERDHPQNNVNLSYIKQSGDTQYNSDGGDQYTGLDRFGRVIDQNWLNTSTSTTTDRFQYGYDQDSDVLYRQNLVDAVMSELYQYDNLNQLINFQRGTLNSTHNGIVGSPSRSQSWTPDALGNFTGVTTNGTTQTRAANQQNEYTSISGSGTITYDANGNITADGSGNTFVYDAWNRLVSVKSGATTLASYSYDGMNRRITETHGSTTTDLYYSANWQVLEERNNGQLQARYVWSPAGIDMLVLRDDSSLNNGVLDRRLYVQQDMLGNVTALVDTSGNLVERYDYDPFGAATILNPDFSVRGTSTYNWNYLFQGKRYDGAVGLYDSRGRVYSPTLMRWLQPDPSGFIAKDDNLYRSFANNPIARIDPTGEKALVFDPDKNTLDGDVPNKVPDGWVCKEILQWIQWTVKSLVERALELDPSSKTYQGHLKRFNIELTWLEKLLKRYNDLGCGDKEDMPKNPVPSNELLKLRTEGQRNRLQNGFKTHNIPVTIPRPGPQPGFPVDQAPLRADPRPLTIAAGLFCYGAGIVTWSINKLFSPPARKPIPQPQPAMPPRPVIHPRRALPLGR